MVEDFHTSGRIELNGFEDAFIAAVAQRFRFSGEYLSNVPLKVGRHLFVQDMRTTDELIADAAALGEEYDPEREPCIAIFTTPTQGLMPTISRGSRHEWTLKIVMRLGTVMEECKARLEELTEYLDNGFRGAYIEGYAVKGCLLQIRPNAFQVEDSDQAYCEVQMRLFAVPRVRE